MLTLSERARFATSPEKLAKAAASGGSGEPAEREHSTEFLGRLIEALSEHFTSVQVCGACSALVRVQGQVGLGSLIPDDYDGGY